MVICLCIEVTMLNNNTPIQFINQVKLHSEHIDSSIFDISKWCRVANVFEAVDLKWNLRRIHIYETD